MAIESGRKDVERAQGKRQAHLGAGEAVFAEAEASTLIETASRAAAEVKEPITIIVVVCLVIVTISRLITMAVTKAQEMVAQKHALDVQDVELLVGSERRHICNMVEVLEDSTVLEENLLGMLRAEVEAGGLPGVEEDVKTQLLSLTRSFAATNDAIRELMRQVCDGDIVDSTMADKAIEEAESKVKLQQLSLVLQIMYTIVMSGLAVKSNIDSFNEVSFAQVDEGVEEKDPPAPAPAPAEADDREVLEDGMTVEQGLDAMFCRRARRMLNNPDEHSRKWWADVLMLLFMDRDSPEVNKEGELVAAGGATQEDRAVETDAARGGGAAVDGAAVFLQETPDADVETETDVPVESTISLGNVELQDMGSAETAPFSPAEGSGLGSDSSLHFGSGSGAVSDAGSGSGAGADADAKPTAEDLLPMLKTLVARRCPGSDFGDMLSDAGQAVSDRMVSLLRMAGVRKADVIVREGPRFTWGLMKLVLFKFGHDFMHRMLEVWRLKSFGWSDVGAIGKAIFYFAFYFVNLIPVIGPIIGAVNSLLLPFLMWKKYQLFVTNTAKQMALIRVSGNNTMHDLHFAECQTLADMKRIEDFRQSEFTIVLDHLNHAVAGLGHGLSGGSNAELRDRLRDMMGEACGPASAHACLRLMTSSGAAAALKPLVPHRELLARCVTSGPITDIRVSHGDQDDAALAYLGFQKVAAPFASGSRAAASHTTRPSLWVRRCAGDRVVTTAFLGVRDAGAALPADLREVEGVEVETSILPLLPDPKLPSESLHVHWVTLPASRLLAPTPDVSRVFGNGREAETDGGLSSAMRLSWLYDLKAPWTSSALKRESPDAMHARLLASRYEPVCSGVEEALNAGTCTDPPNLSRGGVGAVHLFALYGGDHSMLQFLAKGAKEAVEAEMDGVEEEEEEEVDQGRDPGVREVGRDEEPIEVSAWDAGDAIEVMPDPVETTGGLDIGKQLTELRNDLKRIGEATDSALERRLCSQERDPWTTIKGCAFADDSPVDGRPWDPSVHGDRPEHGADATGVVSLLMPVLQGTGMVHRFRGDSEVRGAMGLSWFGRKTSAKEWRLGEAEASEMVCPTVNPAVVVQKHMRPDALREAQAQRMVKRLLVEAEREEREQDADGTGDGDGSPSGPGDGDEFEDVSLDSDAPRSSAEVMGDAAAGGGHLEPETDAGVRVTFRVVGQSLKYGGGDKVETSATVLEDAEATVCPQVTAVEGGRDGSVVRSWLEQVAACGGETGVECGSVEAAGEGLRKWLRHLLVKQTPRLLALVEPDLGPLDAQTVQTDEAEAERVLSTAERQLQLHVCGLPPKVSVSLGEPWVSPERVECALDPQRAELRLPVLVRRRDMADALRSVRPAVSVSDVVGSRLFGEEIVRKVRQIQVNGAGEEVKGKSKLFRKKGKTPVESREVYVNRAIRADSAKALAFAEEAAAGDMNLVVNLNVAGTADVGAQVWRWAGGQALVPGTTGARPMADVASVQTLSHTCMLDPKFPVVQDVESGWAEHRVPVILHRGKLSEYSLRHRAVAEDVTALENAATERQPPTSGAPSDVALNIDKLASVQTGANTCFTVVGWVRDDPRVLEFRREDICPNPEFRDVALGGGDAEADAEAAAAGAAGAAWTGAYPLELPYFLRDASERGDELAAVDGTSGGESGAETQFSPGSSLASTLTALNPPLGEGAQTPLQSLMSRASSTPMGLQLRSTGGLMAVQENRIRSDKLLSSWSPLDASRVVLETAEERSLLHNSVVYLRVERRDGQARYAGAVSAKENDMVVASLEKKRTSAARVTVLRATPGEDGEDGEGRHLLKRSDGLVFRTRKSSSEPWAYLCGEEASGDDRLLVWLPETAAPGDHCVFYATALSGTDVEPVSAGPRFWSVPRGVEGTEVAVDGSGVSAPVLLFDGFVGQFALRESGGSVSAASLDGMSTTSAFGVRLVRVGGGGSGGGVGSGPLRSGDVVKVQLSTGACVGDRGVFTSQPSLDKACGVQYQLHVIGARDGDRLRNMDTVVLRSVKSSKRALTLRSGTRRGGVGETVEGVVGVSDVDTSALELEVDAHWRVVLSA